MKRDAHLQSLFYLLCRGPSKGALPEGKNYDVMNMKQLVTLINK
jgi:hypothetical protein